MRRFAIALALGLGLAVGCTQNFDSFTIGNGGASGDAALVDGAAGGDGADVSAGGTDGGADASPDAPLDAPSDAPPDGPVCGLGTKLCGTSCVLETNSAFGCASPNCSPCSIPHATPSCDSTGKCAIASCDAGFADCNSDPSDGCETDLKTDTANCGTCGNKCVEPNATASCAAGACAVGTCDANYEDCNSDPVDGCESKTDADPQHCGSCSNSCAQNETCTAGACKTNTCPSGTAECDGNPGTVCEADLTKVPNCGFCGNTCTLNNATGKCDATGHCAIGSCKSGYADCDGVAANGCETNLLIDAQNCGTCKRACSTNHATSESCSGGVCSPSCSPGYGDCSSPSAPTADNGCETDLGSSPNNCGACSRKCSTSHIATASCSAGRCDSTCTSGWGNCTQPYAPTLDNGCETNLGSSTGNCGACGHVCAGNNVQTLACSGGACSPNCVSGYGDCSTPTAPAADNGCETPVSFDADNCGACGRKCSGNHVSSRSCSLGKCDSLCQAGYNNCTQPSPPAGDDGCETDVNIDPDNCGVCGRKCSSTQVAARSCSGGTCNSTCNSGHGNCLQPASPTPDDGCETVTTSNSKHCGSCSNACSGLQYCNSTTCTACPAGKGDCDGNSANGCETDVGSDPLNCGGCGRKCSTANVLSLSCNGGVCDSICKPGHSNCSQPSAPTADDGCEQGANDAHCGSCSNSCTAQGFSCGGNVCGCSSSSQCQSSGSCVNGGVCRCDINNFGGTITCKPGETCHWVGTPGSLRNCQCNGGGACGSGQVCCQIGGCKNLSNDAANCGSCGRKCAAGFGCSSSNCVCSGDPSCNAGSAGTCSSGVCTCGTTTCAPGQRCLSNGSCG